MNVQIGNAVTFFCHPRLCIHVVHCVYLLLVKHGSAPPASASLLPHQQASASLLYFVFTVN